jgi:hypothetical protein
MGGLWGSVLLEGRNASWLDEVFVQPQFTDLGYSSVVLNISATMRGSAVLPAAAPEFTVEVYRWQPADERGTTSEQLAAVSVIVSEVTPGGTISAQITLKNPKLWAPDAPALYVAVATLTGFDTVTTRFGIKDLRVDGGQIMLNGAPIFLAGTQENFIYPEHEYGFPTKQSYIDRIQFARSFGYNTYRLSCHFETPRFYEAADEAGLLVQSAKDISHDYADCGVGPNNTFAPRQWRDAIVRLRNHPSAFSFSMGNEAYNPPKEITSRFYGIAKAANPAALVIDTDGCCVKPNCDGSCKTEKTVDTSSCDRPTNDYMVAHMGYCDLMSAPDKYVLPNGGKDCCNKPVIGHEVECYEAFPALKREMVGSEKWNEVASTKLLKSAADYLDKLNLRQEEELWASSSAQLRAFTLRKENEAVRLSPGMKGVNHLIFQSEWISKEGSVGVNFCPYDSDPARAQQFRAFNGDVVILAPSIRALYTADEDGSVTESEQNTVAVQSQVLVSNFGARGNLTECTLDWKFENASSASDDPVQMTSDPVASGSIPIADGGNIPAGKPILIGTLRTNLSIDSLIRLNLTIALRCANQLPDFLDVDALQPRQKLAKWQQSWTTWLFPTVAEWQPPEPGRSLHIEKQLLAAPAIAAMFPTAKPLSPGSSSYPSRNALLLLSGAAKPDEIQKALAAARAGATVMLLQPNNETTGLPLHSDQDFSFHDSLAGGQNSHYTGHVAYPQLRALAPDAPGFTDGSWVSTLTGFNGNPPWTWCSGVRCCTGARGACGAGPKVFNLDGPQFGSGFNKSSVWLRGTNQLAPSDGARAGGHLESKPVHDAALVFNMSLGKGQVVVSGLVLGFESPPWTHCGASTWRKTCPAELLWMLRTIVASANRLKSDDFSFSLGGHGSAQLLQLRTRVATISAGYPDPRHRTTDITLTQPTGGMGRMQALLTLADFVKDGTMAREMTRAREAFLTFREYKTKIVQGWPKLWANFKALIVIFSQIIGPSLAIWGNPVQFSFNNAASCLPPSRSASNTALLSAGNMGHAPSPPPCDVRALDINLSGLPQYVDEEEAEEPGLDRPELVEEKKESSRVFDPGFV